MLKELKIGTKTYPLIFGIGFIREMDKRYEIKHASAGVSFGFGLGSTAVYLKQKNPVILFDLIQAATITEKQKPSVDDIEVFLESDDTDLEKLFKDFLKSLETSPLTKGMMAELRKADK